MVFFKVYRPFLKSIFAFIVFFVFGINVFLSVESLSNSYQNQLSIQKREMLEGDFHLNLRRELNSQEKLIINNTFEQNLKPVKQSFYLDFLTQIRTDSLAKLVTSKVLDVNYPILENTFYVNLLGEKKGLPQKGQLYLQKELKGLLKLKVGDSIFVGQKKLRVEDFITESPESKSAAFKFGYSIWWNISDFKESALEQKGSRISRHYLYLFHSHLENQKNIKDKLLKELKDPEIQMEWSFDKRTNAIKEADMVLVYLKLVSLLCFFIALIGGLPFLKQFIKRFKKTIALLKLYGMSSFEFWRMQVLFILFLVFISYLLVLPISYFTGEWMSVKVYEVYHLQVQNQMEWGVFFKTFFVSLISLILGVFYSFWELNHSEPHDLIRLKEERKTPFIPTVISVLLWALWFWIVPFWLTSSTELAWVFWLILGVGWMSSLFLAWLMLKFFLRMQKNGIGFPLFFVWLGGMRKNSSQALTFMSVISMTTLILVLIPQLKFLFVQEMKNQFETDSASRWFLTDIQETNLDSMAKIIKSLDHKLLNSWKPQPMIRARLTQVNSISFEKFNNEGTTLEQEREKRFRNRGYNLSFRENLYPTERIVQGTFWKSKVHEGQMAQVSVEEGFAKKLKFKLSDTLVFDLEGIQIKGQVTSIRKIRWTDFNPNFFVLFQPGVLELAPKTYLASLPQSAKLSADVFQYKLTESFPAVTVLDLKESVDWTQKTLDQMIGMLSLLSGFSLICGLSVAFTLIMVFLQQRMKEFAVLLSLGLTRRQLYWQISLIVACLTLIPLAFGVLLGGGAAFGINFWLWDFYFQIHYNILLWVMLAWVVLSVFCFLGCVAMLKTLSLKMLLKSENT